MTGPRSLTPKDFPLPGCKHERTTSEFVDELGTYRATYDNRGADVTDPAEGAETGRLMRKLKGENVEQ